MRRRQSFQRNEGKYIVFYTLHYEAIRGSCRLERSDCSGRWLPVYPSLSGRQLPTHLFGQVASRTSVQSGIPRLLTRLSWELHHNLRVIPDVNQWFRYPRTLCELTASPCNSFTPVREAAFWVFMREDVLGSYVWEGAALGFYVRVAALGSSSSKSALGP